MSQLRVRCDATAYNAAIAASVHGARWALALELVGEMLRGQLACDSITYTAAIVACDNAGRWEATLGLLHDMAQRRV
eukprot:3759152-Heterocapsa_arctica.AAC.1